MPKPYPQGYVLDFEWPAWLITLIDATAAVTLWSSRPRDAPSRRARDRPVRASFGPLVSGTYAPGQLRAIN